MKFGAKTNLFLGIVGTSIFILNLIELLSGQGDIMDILMAFFFLLMSAEGFISYLRDKGKTRFHFIS